VIYLFKAPTSTFFIRTLERHWVLITHLAELGSGDYFLRTCSGVLRGVMGCINLQSDYENTGFQQDWVGTGCAEKCCDIFV
jgi:hypothetical protein